MDKETLIKYRSQNPAKFAQKFGAIDLDDLPEGFNLEEYRAAVVAERIRREKNPQVGLPEITPWLFVAPREDEPKSEKNSKKTK